MKATITSVDPETRPWANAKGQAFVFISGDFDDGSQWSYMTTPDKQVDRVVEFGDLIGQEHEFTVQSKDDFRNRRQWKLIDYPGSPKERAQSAPTGRPGRFRDTMEGFRAEQDSINRSVALKAAVDYTVGFAGRYELDTVQVAGLFYRWLSGEPISSGGGDGAGASIENTTDGGTPLGKGDTPAPISPETEKALVALLGKAGALKAARERFTPDIMAFEDISEDAAKILLAEEALSG